MKKLFRISMLMLTALCFAISCSKDTIHLPAETPDPNQEVGYLVLAGMNLNVTTDVETIESTRTPAAADGTYKIIITNSTTSEEAWTGTYADIKAMTSPLELKPGSYKITASSTNTIASAEWEKPEYAGCVDVIITKKQTTTAPNLICTLANIKTTVTLSADLKKLFLNDGTNDLKSTVSLSATESGIFTRDETRALFFKSLAESNTMTVVLTGRYNVKGEGETPEYQPVTMTQTIQNVKAGQWRKIAISIEHTDEGNVQFVVRIETWVYDEQITVDVMSKSYTFGEETIPDDQTETSDPKSPVLTLEGGHDIAQPFCITSSIFDENLGICTDFIRLIATPEGSSTITDAYCTVESDNATFTSALTAAGYAKGKITLFPTNGASKYLSIQTDNTHRLLVNVNNPGMYALFDYAGTHTVKIVTTDSQQRKSYTTLTISVVKGDSSAGPSIVWLNHDITQRYPIQETMDVVVKVNSKTGITGFTIDIISTALTSTDLESFGLAAHMDLVTPASAEMKQKLQQLGFLPADGSSIEGLKETSFDISTFIPLLGMLGTGDSDFKLTVTDASGTAIQTLMYTVK
ncbi:MAG: DUF4493 domain-containing protein [Alistipes sp.]